MITLSERAWYAVENMVQHLTAMLSKVTVSSEGLNAIDLSVSRIAAKLARRGVAPGGAGRKVRLKCLSIRRPLQSSSAGQKPSIRL